MTIVFLHRSFNHLVFISAHSKEVLSCNRNFLSNTNCIPHSAFTWGYMRPDLWKSNIHNKAFLDIHTFTSVTSTYLNFCSVAKSMLYWQYLWNTMLDSKRNNTLALHVFLQELILHTFNYTIVTYGYFNVWSWEDKTIHLSMKWLFQSYIGLFNI